MPNAREGKRRLGFGAALLALLALLGFWILRSTASPPPARSAATPAPSAEQAPQRDSSRPLSSDRPAAAVALAPEADASLRGALISARTLQPVAPGEISVTPLDETQMHPDTSAEPAGQLLVAADSSGRFAIKLLKAGRYFVDASSPGYAHETRIVHVPAKAPLVLAMRDAAFISGRVVHEDQTPAADATVLALSASEELKTATSAGGAFSLEVAPGVHSLFARAGALSGRLDAPVETKPGQTVEGIVIVLKSGTSLSGRVRDDAGEPIAGAKISLSLVTGLRSADWLCTTTDRDGHYQLEHLAPGSYAVFAAATGYAPGEPARAVITSSPSTIDLVLHGIAAVEGRVLGRDGAPISEALVAIAGAAEARVDADGHFLFEGLAPGKSLLSARRPGQTIGAAAQVLLVASTTVHQDLQLGSEATLHGVVHYRSGAALESPARVTAWRDRDSASSGVETDAAGAYSMTLEEGEYTVSARPLGWVGGFAIASGVAVTLAAGEDRELDLNEPQDGPDDGIHGLVLEPGGAPSIKPLISAVIEGQGQRNFRGREDGTFDLPMPQLNGAAIALYAGNGGREGSGRAGEQATQPIIQLLPAATLEGEVQRADGQAVTSFTLAIAHPNNVMADFIDAPSYANPEALQLTGSSFVLDDLAAGAVHLVATAPDGSTGELDLQLQPGELAHAQLRLGAPSATPPQRDPRRRL